MMTRDTIDKQNIMLLSLDGNCASILVYSKTIMIDGFVSEDNIKIEGILRLIDFYKDTHFLCLQKKKDTILLFLNIIENNKSWAMVLERQNEFFIFLLENEYEMYVFDDDFSIISDIHAFMQNRLAELGGGDK